MKAYELPARSLPLDESYDVIVVGGGPAGCTAAAAAARQGARTLLLEATGSLGGMGTSALVPAWTPFSDKEKIIYRGLAEQIFVTLRAGMPHIDPHRLDWVPIDPEQLKCIYDSVVTGFGADILFHTQLSAVIREGDRVDALVVASKAGLTVYRAKTYIDCSGDADLCAWAGADFHKGNAEGGNLMPATHCFVLSNVDEAALKAGPGVSGAFAESPIYKIRESGRYPLIPDCHICIAKLGPGTYGFNAGHLWDVDNTRPETVSKAMVHGRKMARSYRDALAEFFPEAFGHCFLVNTGSLMGIRETRRVVGDYVLTLEDYLQRRSFPDEICRNCYFIDIHSTKTEIAKNPEEYRASCEKGVVYGPGESHGIPYRSLIPRGLENVLVAGRSISCEQIVQGSVRVMPVCLAMGEAAGLAAGVASAHHRGRVRDVDPGRLRDKLRELGAYLPDFSDTPPLQ